MKKLPLWALTAPALVLSLTATGTVTAQSAPQTTATATSAQLRVDANRDGQVDLSGASDDAGTTASIKAGALFLPNIDDDARRCGKTAVNCNDAADAVVNGADDEADLAVIKAVPMTGLAAGATGNVSIEAPANAVRLFVKRGSTYSVVTSNTSFSKADLEAGLHLALEGRDILRDSARWNGVAKITLNVLNGQGRSSSTVALQQAPMLSHHHLQTAQSLIAAPAPSYREFISGMNTAARTAGLPAINYLEPGDQWAQDWVEPMYVSMPTARGVQGMRILMRSDQDRDAQMLLYGLRGKDVGVVQLAARPYGNTRNSFGNLETIPPHAGYPAGRIILGFADGSYENPSPTLQTVLAAQQMQAPLKLDTSWLGVGHVDEFVQFLPAKNARGWVIGVADPRGTRDLLKKAEADGHGNVPVSQTGTYARTTISQLLRDRGFNADQDEAQRRIDDNLAILKRETGVTDAEIVRIPGLYRSERNNYGPKNPKGQKVAAEKNMVIPESGKAEVAAASASSFSMGSLHPGAVNSVVTSNSTMAVAKQFGPVIGGRDLMDDAVTKAYGSIGMGVTFVDDYYSYHALQGEVHCGSNSMRTITRWW